MERSQHEAMKPRITVITLGVDDLEGSLKFYRDGLALPTQGVIGTEFEHGAVAFFDLQAGFKIAILPPQSFVHDTNIPPAAPNSTQIFIRPNMKNKRGS